MKSVAPAPCGGFILNGSWKLGSAEFERCSLLRALLRTKSGQSSGLVSQVAQAKSHIRITSEPNSKEMQGG